MSIQCRLSIRQKSFSLNVDFTVPAKGITALFGPSGCGKTTLLRAFAGLEYCPDGFLRVGEMLWQDGKKFVPPHKRALGYVFQEASLFPHLNVRGNVEYGMKRVSSGEGRLSLDKAIDLLGIASLLERRPDQLSGGERQRVAIARALAVNPRILLMDEPLSALDLSRKQEIMPFLESLHDELDIPVIYVSHAPDEVARLADHLLLLNDGRITGSGPVSEMLTSLDMPLAHADEAAAIIEARVAGYDEEYGLALLEFPGGNFAIPRKDLVTGSPVRIRVAAHDVSLTLEHQSETSILNIFPATVEEVASEGDAQVMVRFTVSGVPMLSRVTKKSASLLDLKPGKSLFAQIKSVVLLS